MRVPDGKGRFDGRVAVSPHDEGDAGNGCGELPVPVQAQVGKDDHEDRPLRPHLLQEAREHLLRFEEREAFHVLRHGDPGGVGRGEADDGDFQAFRSRSTQGFTRGSPPFPVHDVGGKEGNVRRPIISSRKRHPPVELVVSHGHGVEPQEVHDLDDRLPAQDVRNGGSLDMSPPDRSTVPPGFFPLSVSIMAARVAAPPTGSVLSIAGSIRGTMCPWVSFTCRTAISTAAGVSCPPKEQERKKGRSRSRAAGKRIRLIRFMFFPFRQVWKSGSVAGIAGVV
jgi:hypothetical protein